MNVQAQPRTLTMERDPVAAQAGVVANMSQRLKQFRARKGLSRQELAQCAGLTLIRLGLFENGVRIPTVDELFGMAACLDVEIPDLVD